MGMSVTFSSPNPHIKNPEYYLHRDFDKNYSFSGTPFIGAGADENSDAFVIYAHNMNNGTRIFEQNPSTSTNRTFTIVPSPESNCIGRWFLISDEPKPLFAGHSVTLGGDIGVNFFIDGNIAGVADAETAVVKFAWDGGKYIKEVDLKELTPNSAP